MTVGESPDDVISYSALMENDFELPDIDINPKEDGAFILYSSGTTGDKKGILCTHMGLIVSCLHEERYSWISHIVYTIIYLHNDALQI